jgi:dihydroceramide fatty acyl 2-hydroxylase
MEWFTHVHPITPLLIWVPVVAFLFWRSYETHQLNAFSILSVAFVAFVFWTFAEYVLHRWVFHYVGDTQFSRRMQFMIHGLHHDDPSDYTRLVMPPFASIWLATGFYFLYRSILGPIWVDPFFAGFLIGYLVYDYTHYSVHHFRPRTRLGKMLKQNHMNHHFKAPDSLWGVSSPIWDYVFGTTQQRAATHSGSASPLRHGS